MYIIQVPFKYGTYLTYYESLYCAQHTQFTCCILCLYICTHTCAPMHVFTVLYMTCLWLCIDISLQWSWPLPSYQGGFCCPAILCHRLQLSMKQQCINEWPSSPLNLQRDPFAHFKLSQAQAVQGSTSLLFFSRVSMPHWHIQVYLNMGSLQRCYSVSSGTNCLQTLRCLDPTAATQ